MNVIVIETVVVNEIVVVIEAFIKSTREDVKMKTTKFLLLIAISIVWLSACGGGGGGSGGGDDPYDPPPPPPMDGFPSQVATPTSMVVNDNGSLVLAASGLSLYTFDDDTMGTSTCEGTSGDIGTCAGRWPPLLASSGAQANEIFTIISRADGDNQWVLYGQPLYHYYEDVSQGDVMGDGLGGIWHLARRMPVTVTTINQLPTYVGFETILTVTESSMAFTPERVDKHDFTLYTFNPDPVNDSACYGFDGCINAWPPLLADAGATAMPPLNIVDVAGGNRQWSFKGKPLYFFVGDNNAGDVDGDDIPGWHTATLEPAIQRTNKDMNLSLSATGMVNVLMSVNGEVMSMINKDGYSLYTFDIDGDGMSNCQDENDCLMNWPAFVADDGEPDIGAFTRFTRGDGTDQWAHNGRPLYFYMGDMQRGDTEGDGVGGVWHLILPPPPPPVNPNANINWIQDNVFTPICTQCHSGPSPAAGMDLSDGQSFANLVNVDATRDPLSKRVLPMDAAQSILYLKVSGTQAGAQMPFMLDPLSAEQMQAIKEWIDLGAMP